MTAVPAPPAAATEHPPPAALVAQLIGGYWATQTVYVVAKLGLADLISTGVDELNQLAEATDTDPDALRRLLRAAGGLGLVTRGPDGDYRLTALGECLRTDSPQSVRHTAMVAGDFQYRAWSELLHSVRTGEPAFARVLGQPFFDYLAANPETAADTIYRAVAEFLHRGHIPALAGYDFGRSGTVVDIGGGTGYVLRHVLQTNPGLRGVLFDRAGVIAHAVPELRTGELAARCTLVTGNFFDQVPGGGDTYLISFVLHDFDDQQAAALLGSVRAAVPPGGRLLVLDLALPEDDTPHLGKLMDLNMLVTTGGRERTLAELERLLATSGFRLDRVVPSPSPINVLVAFPV